MKRIVAHILLVMSLGAALVIAGRPAGTSGDVAAIRLPSDGQGLGSMKKVLEEGERPWACCDHTQCLRVLPRACLCHDTVAQCASACQHCDEVSHGRYVCLDLYEGWPGPKCTHEVDVAAVGN
ncbi:Bowman-Birk type major trypsin inhibitor-like [Triticum dicoccoides]|uniref:Bowman-Birk type major trypsin inhibitor-like n=1 Tax=Triticum dicoccoides TaxID=85692 RepID=UPI000E7B272D|nr:Bowman-Birk type major trypsin inhibitor-like [Triticum dicoccoides]